MQIAGYSLNDLWSRDVSINKRINHKQYEQNVSLPRFSNTSKQSQCAVNGIQENALKLYELIVQLSIGLLHFISETCKNISVVEGPDKLFSIRSIRSICQMENSYIRAEKCSFPLDCCISLARLRKISPLDQDPITFCRFDRFGRFVKWRILIFDRKSAAFHIHHHNCRSDRFDRFFLRNRCPPLQSCLQTWPSRALVFCSVHQIYLHKKRIL